MNNLRILRKWYIQIQTLIDELHALSRTSASEYLAL